MIDIAYETDVEGDFYLREGALFVRGNDKPSPQPYGAEKRMPNIYAIHKHVEDKGGIILGSSDRHFYEDAELIRNKGGVFDDHCMNGTKGQLRARGLEPQKDIYIQSKEGPMLGLRTYTPQELQRFIDRAKEGKAQLIFEKQSYDVGTNPNFELTMKMLLDDLEKEDPEGVRVYLDGFALVYCVDAAFFRMAEIKKKYQKKMELYVVTDAVEAVNIDFDGNVDPDLGKKSLEKMAAAGAKLVTTQEVLEGKI